MIFTFYFTFLCHVCPNYPHTGLATATAPSGHQMAIVVSRTVYYHGILLGMMEQNELTWADHPLIQELRLQYTRQPSPAHTATHTQAQNRPVQHISLEHAHTMAIMDLTTAPRCLTFVPGAFGYDTRPVNTRNQAVSPSKCGG